MTPRRKTYGMPGERGFFHLKRDGLFADRNYHFPFRKRWLLVAYDLMMASIVVGLVAELGIELYYFITPTSENVAWATTRDLFLFYEIVFDLSFVGFWILIVREHFRHRGDDLARMLILIFMPVVYTWYYYFRHLRPELLHKLKTGTTRSHHLRAQAWYATLDTEDA